MFIAMKIKIIFLYFFKANLPFYYKVIFQKSQVRIQIFTFLNLAKYYKKKIEKKIVF